MASSKSLPPDDLSDTLSQNFFIRHIFPPNHPSTDELFTLSSSSPLPAPPPPPPTISMSYRKSLEELSKEIKEIEDFITVTEDILRRERERDREFYARERQRRRDSQRKTSAINKCSAGGGGNKENRTPTVQIYSVSSPTYKVRGPSVAAGGTAFLSGGGPRAALRKCKSASPKSATKRRHQHLRSGRVSCISVDDDGASILNVNTEDLVKRIVQLNNISNSGDLLRNYEFLSHHSLDDGSIDNNENGKSSSKVAGRTRFDSSTEDNLEMVIIEKQATKGDDNFTQTDYGLIEGLGQGAELTRSATMPSSASSGQSNAT